jgi:3-hydroxyisobutyrate dehydrogenase-like beta-hydroxyacid dehydrogenase
MSDQQVVAVVGLGRMGTGMAHSLLRAGFTVRVFNRTPEKAAPLVAQGAVSAGSPADAARGADAVLSSLLDDGTLRAVVEAEDGLLAGLETGSVHISTSTVSPGCSNEMASLHAVRGLGFLAAPVLGRPDVALAGELLSLAGGEQDVLDRARPFIEAYSSRILHTGTGAGTANSLKLAFNFYIAASAELFGQFLTFTEKSGVEHDTAMQALRGMQGSPAINGYLERIGAREFDEVGFAMSTGLKDLRLMLDAAAEVRCPLPYAAVAHDHTLSALATGLGEQDWSAFTEVARLNAGLS